MTVGHRHTNGHVVLIAVTAEQGVEAGKHHGEHRDPFGSGEPFHPIDHTVGNGTLIVAPAYCSIGGRGRSMATSPASDRPADHADQSS